MLSNECRCTFSLKIRTLKLLTQSFDGHNVLFFFKTNFIPKGGFKSQSFVLSLVLYMVVVKDNRYLALTSNHGSRGTPGLVTFGLITCIHYAVSLSPVDDK